METSSNNKTRTIRELHLDLCEVGDTLSAFEYALKMCKALRNKEITFDQFDMLCGDLYSYCNRNNIPTSNEICSLF